MPKIDDVALTRQTGVAKIKLTLPPFSCHQGKKMLDVY